MSTAGDGGDQEDPRPWPGGSFDLVFLSEAPRPITLKVQIALLGLDLNKKSLLLCFLQHTTVFDKDPAQFELDPLTLILVLKYFISTG